MLHVTLAILPSSFRHDNILVIMSTSSSLTSLLILLVAVLTAFLVYQLSPGSGPATQSPDPRPVTTQSSSSSPSSQTTFHDASEGQKIKEDAGVTFLQKMKRIDLSEVVPLQPGSGPLLISEVDAFNNVKIAPRLQSIVAMDYFRFVKLNMSKKCSLWSDNDRCAERCVEVQ